MTADQPPLTVQEDEPMRLRFIMTVDVEHLPALDAWLKLEGVDLSHIDYEAGAGRKVTVKWWDGKR